MPGKPRRSKVRRRIAPAVMASMLLAAPFAAHATERVTLRNGFTLDCLRREPVGDRIRLYMDAAGTNYMDVPSGNIVSVETLPDPPAAPAAKPALAAAGQAPSASRAELTREELTELLAHAGEAHNIDADLLAALVRAESGGHAHAVSRAGARGLMQLMPGTAATLGVADSFAPAQNVEGGTRYLDQLLTRYQDNIALALAAYNAGPGAVDRYHGIPPFRETRAYVAGIIREFNRRKTTTTH